MDKLAIELSLEDWARLHDALTKAAVAHGEPYKRLSGVVLDELARKHRDPQELFALLGRNAAK